MDKIKLTVTHAVVYTYTCAYIHYNSGWTPHRSVAIINMKIWVHEHTHTSSDQPFIHTHVQLYTIKLVYIYSPNCHLCCCNVCLLTCAAIMGPQYTYLLCSLTSTTSEYSLTYERSDSSGTFIATLKTLVCIQSILDYCGETFSLVPWLIHWSMVGLGGCGLAHFIHGHTSVALGVAKGKPIIALSKPFLGHRGISHCSLATSRSCNSRGLGDCLRNQ